MNKKPYKLITLFIFLLWGTLCYSQKINACSYNKVDTLIKYNNAQTITYRNKIGKSITDTVFYAKMRCDININEVGVMIINHEIVLQRKNNQ